ncbi:hypothetical protein MYD03_00095 [Mediterraneibacter gnavus]
MKTIGMIVAVEIQSVLKRYGAKLVKRKEQQGTRCWNMRRTNIGWSL